MFEGFAQSSIETERGEITLVHGSGPLPALAERFTGGRSRSARLPRAVAGDQVEMMAALGFDRFAVVGHERHQATGRAFARAHFIADELRDDTVSELLAFPA